MNQAQAQQLEKLFNLGYLIIIDAGGHVDSPVQSIISLEDATTDIIEDINSNGQIIPDWDKLYSSEVFDARPLSQVELNEVRVYKPFIGWIEADDLEQQPEDPEWEEYYYNLGEAEDPSNMKLFQEQKEKQLIDTWIEAMNYKEADDLIIDLFREHITEEAVDRSLRICRILLQTEMQELSDYQLGLWEGYWTQRAKINQ